MNYIPQVAKMLGVEIGERFTIKEYEGLTYYFTENALMLNHPNYSSFPAYRDLADLIYGISKIVKIPFEPKMGDKYYAITWSRNENNEICEPTISSIIWNGDMVDYAGKAIGNVFRTEAEAEAHKYEIYEKLTGKKWEEKDE